MSGPPCMEGHSIVNMDTDEITIQDIVGAPLNDTGTDVEDELLTPASSPAPGEMCPVATGDSGLQPVHEDNFNIDLAKALLDVSVLPMMIALIHDPIVSATMSPVDYIAPEILTVSADERAPESAFPPATVTMDSWFRQYSPISRGSSNGVGTSARHLQCCPRYNYRLMHPIRRHTVEQRWTSTCRECRRHQGSHQTLPCNRI